MQVSITAYNFRKVDVYIVINCDKNRLTNYIVLDTCLREINAHLRPHRSPSESKHVIFIFTKDKSFVGLHSNLLKLHLPALVSKIRYIQNIGPLFLVFI